MAGLVIFTGANSSLGVHAAEHLLTKFPEYTVLLTVRDDSSSDVNTEALRKIISNHSNAKATIRALDLSSLSAVHAFADTVVSEIREGKFPSIAAITCNAYYWNLIRDPELTADGYDKTIQVSHISHAALILRLLGSFSPSGRVILISSDAHWPGKNSSETYPPAIPDDLNLLVDPVVDSDKAGRGFQRYANAKLAMTTWMYALNRHLQKEEKLKTITAVAMNPGNLLDSRALTTNTPKSKAIMQKIAVPLLPVLRLMMGPTLRKSAPAGVDVAEMTFSADFAGKRGFYTLLDKDESSPDSQDREKQERLWAQTLKWAKITKDNTVLQAGL
ncbi:NAD(P)-binding Rossmann-fold containing protein [Glarea lozoyensis ATCC 20868]|uniref:NAD(P)-binding Rossmann-fold containing protein n=1 Tax=Glarea lozoyensis (strain ATCC 20868 / MF5171) TaxID=1116229 RepID=S3DX12_GLAL2|nr:NAD(P)-binding Rossmann-fold containing protein [Glarea lozoyensis ATCC 20868]EPE30918.1 NAD(P)-binding Rossmann-fold containing protein [Glarea lozoyensis ATCC 20868]